LSYFFLRSKVDRNDEVDPLVLFLVE